MEVAGWDPQEVWTRWWIEKFPPKQKSFTYHKLKFHLSQFLDFNFFSAKFYQQTLT
jgi:hypothetical protein